MIDWTVDEQVGALITDTLESFEKHHTRPDAVEQAVALDDESTEEELPENVHVEHFDVLTTHLTSRPGSARIRSHRADEPRSVLLGLRRAAARWLRLPQVRLAREQSADDYALGWACAVVTLAPNDRAMGHAVPTAQDEDTTLDQPLSDVTEGEERNPLMPIVRIHHRRDVIWDLAPRNARDGAFQGWRALMDLETLVAFGANNDDWDDEAIASLSGQRTERTQEPREATGDTTREIIEVWELWVRGVRLDDADAYEEARGVKTHGTIITIGQGANGWVRLRPDVPAYVDPEGPLVVMGARTVGKCSVPRSPLVTADSAAQHLNAAARAINAGMDNYRRTLVYRRDMAADAERVLTTRHDWSAAVDALFDENGRALFQAVEVGGITAQMLTGYELLRDRYMQRSGLSELMRGDGQESETATADVLKAQGSRARTARVARGFDQGWSEILRRALRYMYESDEVAVSFGADEAEQVARETGMDQPGTMPQAVALELGMTAEEWQEAQPPAWAPGQPLVLRGGSAAGLFQGRFDDLEVELQPGSMQIADDPNAAGQLQAFLQAVLQLAPVAQQIPTGFPWALIVRELGERFGCEEIASEIDLTRLAEMPPLALEMGSSSAGSRASASPPGQRRTVGAQVERGGSSLSPARAQQGQPSPRPQEAAR